MITPTSTADARFTFDVLRAEGPVLVDFYADWCSQCRRLAPVLDALAAEWAGTVTVVKVDVARNAHLADRYGIVKIPTVILFNGGVEQTRLIEPTRRAALEAGLASFVPDLPAEGGRRGSR